jgi:hypothetical protein
VTVILEVIAGQYDPTGHVLRTAAGPSPPGQYEPAVQYAQSFVDVFQYVPGAHVFNVQAVVSLFL